MGRGPSRKVTGARGPAARGVGQARQVGLQPPEGLRAQAGLLPGAQVVRVLALPTGGPDGGAGGAFAVLALVVLGERGAVGEGAGVEPGGGGGVTLAQAEVGEVEALGGAGRLDLPAEQGGEPAFQLAQALGLGEPLA